MKKSFLFLFLGLLFSSLSFSFEKNFNVQDEVKISSVDSSFTFGQCSFNDENLDLEPLLTFHPTSSLIQFSSVLIGSQKIKLKAQTKIPPVYRIFISYPGPPQIV